MPDSSEGSEVAGHGFDDGFGAAVPVRSGRASTDGAAPTPVGLPSWAAVLVLVGIAIIGAAIDRSHGTSVRTWFNWSLVLASLIAILVVKRSQMFSVVIAPPLVYFVVSAGSLYVDSHGLHDRKEVIDAAANWLVYGFPAIAGASAIVLVIAGIRMIVRR